MTIDEIKAKIQNDKFQRSGSYCRYPVRFVFMELSNNTPYDLADLVSSVDGNLICLNDNLASEDGWLTKTMLMNLVKSCSKTQDSIIVGFSELIRFYSSKDLESLILSLIGDIENDLSDSKQRARRIYFVCFSMREYLWQVVYEKFRRLDVYNPFINEEFEYTMANRELLFVNNNLKILDEHNIIKNSKDWLSLWKNAAILDCLKPIICRSPNLYEWYRKVSPDNAFQIEIVENYKELIEKVYRIRIPFKYKDCDESKWFSLYSLFATKTVEVSLDSVARELCNAKSIDVVYAYVTWYASEEQFKKWFLAEYIKFRYPHTLIGQVLESSLFNQNERVLRKIITYPFENNSFLACAERNKLINAVHRHTNMEDYENSLYKAVELNIKQEIGDSAIAFCCELDGTRSNPCKDEMLSSRLRKYVQTAFLPAFTGNFTTEKELAIKMAATSVLAVDDLKGVYDSLYYYLSTEHAVIDEFADSYFTAYRESKLLGIDTSSLVQMIECNSNEESFFGWYYKYKTQSELIKMNKSVAVYVVDGLGGEYMPVLLHLLEKYGYGKVVAEYAVAHIPSITDVNKKYISEVCDYEEWIDDFDRIVIHGELYRTTRNIRKALDTLERIVNRIVSLQDGAPFVLTADHGASARGKWSDCKKIYNFEKADHEGRCLSLGHDEKTSTQDYVFYRDPETGESWLSCLREISLNNNPRFEGHGGATPEELIVPFVVASPTDSAVISKVTYQIEIVSNIVTGIDKKVKFLISPKPTTAFLIDGAGNKIVLEEEGGDWTAELTTGQSQTIKVVVGETRVSFSLVNASASNMARKDDGFDDFD